MYVGYVFLCTAESLKECLKLRLFACSGKSVQIAREIGIGSVVFLLDPDAKTLVGPFTVEGSERRRLEPGAWTEAADTHSLSENIRVEWEDLHEIRDAQDKFPFLKDPETCRLSHFQTQDLLKALKGAESLRITQSSM